MAIQKSVAVRNGELDSLESVVGVSPYIHFFAGAPPANCAAADIGAILVSMALASDWRQAAAGGVSSGKGSYQGAGLAAAGAGTNIGHWRLKSSGGTTHMQGTVTISGAGGDITLDNINVAFGQIINITQADLTAANA